LLATPSRAFRRGIGLLDFDVTADYDYAQGLLTGEYTIRFSATEPSMDASKVLLPLFTVKRTLALKWENGHLAYDNLNSDISPSDIARITSGSYARIYTLFRAEFDKLQKAEGVKWQWFKEFMAVVKDEGVALTAPLSGSPAP
jgi:hypothetical protein